MTSFIIQSQVDRSIPSWTQSSEDCTFCRILRNEIPAFRVFEDDEVLAILDILPLRRGHTLVIPKVHCRKVSDLSPEYAAAVGKAISKVAHALTEALENTALNVVCNQEYAQAVPHVHYHIIPAPTTGGASHSKEKMHQMEFESRGELIDEEAGILAHQIRARLDNGIP